MNFDAIWDTPGYFYALGYSLSTAVLVLFADRSKPLRRALSCLALLIFLLPFSIATKGTWGLPFIASMAVMLAAILYCVYINVGDALVSLFGGVKAFIYGEFAASLCWQIYYSLALNRPALQTWPWLLGIMLEIGRAHV